MDEQEEPTNFVSLFERSTLSRWDATLPGAEVSKEPSWSSLRPSQLFRLFGAKALPESLLFIIEQSLRWKVAYSTVHYALAIQKDGVLEIWRDYCSVPVAKCRILDDEHPQWCKLQWSASGNLLLSARSVGAVDAFDGTGAFCFSIPLPSPDASFNPLYSVASIASAPHTTDTVWSDRIWILQYDGNMRCYLAGRVSGYHPLSTVDVSTGASSVAVTASLLQRAGAMLVSAYDPDAAYSSDEKAITNRGVSIWRITDAEPYLEIFGKQENELAVNSNVQKKSFNLFNSSKEYVLQIVVSSDESSAACLTSRGDVLAFRVPSLQVIKSWSLGDELSPHRETASFITGIGWWSQKELMLLYSTGFVATVNFDSDGTTAAVEKNYSPWAQLICASQGHVLLLEITGRPEKPVAQRRTLSSFVWPLIRFPYALLKLAGKAFVGAPLTAADTDDNQVEQLPCHYVLHEMKAIAPPELFKKKLIASNYEEALTVAQTYCLNADRVYQEQWRKSPVTVETIENFLVKVKQRTWVIEECLVQLPDSLDACKKLLDIGLTLTESLSKLSSEKEIKPKQQECSARYRLVQYRRVLDDYEAADFARLGVLFSRDGRRLFPIWLLLLTNVPETVDFQEYEFLLPKLKEKPDWAEQKQERKVDFIEDERFAEVVESKKDDVECLVKEKPALQSFILSVDGKMEENASKVEKWYEFRAIEIERYSCLPDLAEKFLKMAASNGVTELDDLCEDMGLLRLLNYECSLSTPVSYERLKKMQPLETLHLLLKESPKDIFIKRFEQWAVPFCIRWEQRNEIPAKTLVWKYLVAASEGSLKIPLLLCQSFKTKSEWWLELIDLTPADIIRIVADCLSACGDVHQIDAGFQLVSYSPRLEEDDPDAAIVQSVEDHLTALHLLNVYGIALSYQKLQAVASSAQESAMLLKRLVRHGTSSASTSTQKPDRGASADHSGGGGRLWTTDDWRTLLKDMMQISRTVLPSIGEQRCHELFVDGLLSSKSMDLIDLASKFLVTARDSASVLKKGPVESQQQQQPHLSYDSAVELVAGAAESYINEAVDARDESLNYARKCLHLLENPPDKLIREREFIDALPLLEHFDVRDVPARLKMYKSPIRLVEEIFARKPSAYDEYEKLLRLCKLLRVPIADRHEAKSLLIMCTRQALNRKDASACVKFCREIAASSCSSGWRVCWDACTDLSATPSFNSDIRSKLLIFCLSHCDAGYIEPILNGLRGLKMELLKRNFDARTRRLEHVPWLMSVWNEIKSQAKTDPILDWRTDPVYLDATNYATENEAQPFNEQSVALFNFLRYLLLTEETDSGLLDETLATIGSTTAAAHTHLALMALLGVKNDEICERALRSIPISPVSAEMAMYVHSLRAASQAGVDGSDLRTLLRSDPQTVVKEIYPFLGGGAGNRLKAWTATLVEFPEGVDRDRFATDEQYRKDTIVGLALTADEEAYNQALHLAEIYGISPWEVNVSHLEFLFTESGMNAAALSESIKGLRLLEKLSERRSESHERLGRNVFPLLNGRDHSILLLYYAVESKLAGEPELTAINAHRANLKQLKLIAADIDYKKLISSKSDALDLLLPYLNAENFTAFAKVATKIPNKNFTLEDVLCVWARKVFAETIQKANVTVAFDRCKKVLEKLNCETYVCFVEKSLDGLSPDQTRLDFVRLAIEFAGQRDKLAPCVEKLKEWESFLA